MYTLPASVSACIMNTQVLKTKTAQNICRGILRVNLVITEKYDHWQLTAPRQCVERTLVTCAGIHNGKVQLR